MSMQEAFIDELRDTYDAEKQLIKALTKMAKAATDSGLQQAFQSHLEETRGQVARLEEVFGLLGEKVRGKHCDGIAGIIEEGKSVMEEEEEGAVLDACLVGSGQRAEHYEMAAYGTLIAWAKTLDYADAVPLLQQNLDEEKAADEKLSALAEGGINRRAASEPEEGEKSGSSRGRSSKKSSGGRKASSGKGGSSGRKAAAKKSGSRAGSATRGGGRSTGNKSGRASGSKKAAKSSRK